MTRGLTDGGGRGEGSEIEVKSRERRCALGMKALPGGQAGRRATEFYSLCAEHTSFVCSALCGKCKHMRQTRSKQPKLGRWVTSLHAPSPLPWKYTECPATLVEISPTRGAALRQGEEWSGSGGHPDFLAR